MSKIFLQGGRGYLVSPVIVPEALRASAREAIDTAPELAKFVKRREGGCTSSGFGAIGVASAFHNEPARAIRGATDDFIQTLSFPGYSSLEAVADRQGGQLTSKTRGGESFHRDDTPGAGDSLVLGGFVNLSEGPQYFSCVPGNIGDRANAGFAKIKNPKDLRPLRVRVTIPPGCALLFNELLAHEVKSGKVKTTAYRQYVGAILSKRVYATPLLQRRDKNPFNIDDFCDDQSVPTIKSGQTEHFVVPKLWNVNWKNLVAAHQKLLIPELSVGDKIVKIAPSLRSLRKRYRPYTPEQRAILKPRLLHSSDIIV